jgi:hypothetical protein
MPSLNYRRDENRKPNRQWARCRDKAEASVSIRLCLMIAVVWTCLFRFEGKSWIDGFLFGHVESVCAARSLTLLQFSTEHGQMLGVAIACGRFLAVFRTVHLLSTSYRKLVIFGGRD